jgi:hypothetical protein
MIIHISFALRICRIKDPEISTALLHLKKATNRIST